MPNVFGCIQTPYICITHHSRSLLILGSVVKAIGGVVYICPQICFWTITSVYKHTEKIETNMVNKFEIWQLFKDSVCLFVTCMGFNTINE